VYFLMCYFSEAEMSPSSKGNAADHHVLRTVNSLRASSRGGLPTEQSVLDEFAVFEDVNGDEISHQHSDGGSALEFKPRMKKNPVPSVEEKKLLRDQMFDMMDQNRDEEARLVSM
jgi:hypothetical protein